ncbi:SCO6881 family protein [Streptomyces sp. 7N604]|uniref:SCO6881 family protein n=1 Tax=Streptomyces sp. 7N604 TaxID=3457415 RepID=UPI003FD4B540
MDVCTIPMMDKVCTVVDTVDFVSDPGTAITDGIGAWIAKSAGELAASAADLAAKAVDATTRVDLNAGWFRDNYELLLPIGLILTVGTFIMQLIRAAWRRDERALVQAVFGTMTGVFFAFSAIAFTTVALTVVDALSEGLFKVANSSVDDAVRRVIKVSQYGSMYELGWMVPTFVALGAAIGAFLYWAVMVARKVGILILVTLAVFAGAGGGWEVARRWRRGWIEATATLVVSKLLMTVVFLIGISAMGKSESSSGLAALSDAMAGIVVLILVMLCPYATYKFVHWAADGGGHDDVHRTGVAGMGAIAGAAKTAGSLALQAGIGVPAPQGPAKVPGQGAGGVASGIDPAGGASAPAPKTFRFGEDPNATGDKGRALIQRPPTDGDCSQPLIQRPGQGSASDSETDSAPVSSGPTPQGASVSPPRVTHMDPPAPRRGGPSPGSGPSPQGGTTPQRWVYREPPGGSGS